MSLEKFGVVPGSRWHKVNKEYVRSHGCTYRIVMGPDDTIADVTAIEQLPALFEPYEFDSKAKCISLSIKEQSESGEQGSVWLADAEWSTDAVEKSESPLDEPIRYSLRWEQTEKVVERDIHGNAIANTIGDLFVDPPYTEQDELPILVAVRNFPATALEFLIALALDYKKSTNADIFLGAPVGTAKLKDIQTGEIQKQDDIEYYRVSFEFVFNADGWQPEILNRGHRAKDADGNIYELPNKEVSNLKQDGTVVAEGEQPYYIPFETLNPKSYFALGVV